MFDFSGKIVLITGASGGVGRATAIAFATAGAQVALHYHQQSDRAAAVQAELAGEHHLRVQANLTDAEAVEQLVQTVIDQFGQIDVLVNNAGIYKEHPLDRTSYREWQQIWQETIDTNLIGAVNLTYAVAQQMIARRQGSIVNVTSRGAFRGEPTATAYGASKAGLNAFSQSLAVHLAPYNIGVTAVAPGWINTEMSRVVLESPAGDAIRQQSPLNRVATPEEVAQTILFLASAEAMFLTGAIVDLNGASYLRS